MDMKEYEQSDIWIEQVDAAHKAFGERIENGLLAIEFLIHDLERIKAGEIVFVKDTAQLCRCNNCMAIMIDKNPSDQPEFEVPNFAIDMELIQQEDEETGNMIENFWGCPNCKTDGHLIDVTELKQIQECEQKQ
jgi:hypothetical protein